MMYCASFLFEIWNLKFELLYQLHIQRQIYADQIYDFPESALFSNFCFQ